METTQGTMRNGQRVLVQTFNGKTYKLYPGERYFSRHDKRLHRVVWEFYNGPIPKGCHVHHKDGNPWNNDIENLELVQSHTHLVTHTRKRVAENPEIFQRNMHKAMEAAKDWHRSPEGRKWHSEHAKAQKPQERTEYTCDQCGKAFIATKRETKHHFCSNKCSAAWRRASGLDDVTRTCEWCGKSFITNRYSKQKLCGKACAAAYHSYILKSRRD